MVYTGNIMRFDTCNCINFAFSQEGEHDMRVTDLEDDLRSRDVTIQGLREEIRKTQQGIADMSHELDSKGKEILRIRREANENAR